MTFEFLLHAVFVADEIWGFMLEPARILKLRANADFLVPTTPKNTIGAPFEIAVNFNTRPTAKKKTHTNHPARVQKKGAAQHSPTHIIRRQLLTNILPSCLSSWVTYTIIPSTSLCVSPSDSSTILRSSSVSVSVSV